MSAWVRASLATGFALLVLAVPAVLAYRQAQSHQREIARGEGAHLVDLEREFLARELRAVRSDLAFLAQQPLLARVLDGEPDLLLALAREYEGFARAKPRYAQIRLLDGTGLERVRINRRGDVVERVDPARLQDKGDRYYFLEAIDLPPGSVFVSPLDLNVEQGAIERPPKPVIRLAAPVRGSADGRRGLLVLNYAGSRLLGKLRALASGSRGDTALVNSEGEYLLSPRPGREWGWLLGHDASFRGDHPEAWERLRGAERTAFWLDGDHFTAEWVPLGEGAAVGPSAVAVVSRMPVRTALAPGARAAAAGLGLAALAIVWGLSYTLARAAAARREQERRIAESEARLRLLSSRLLAAQEEERRSLSRVLHDELGQAVTAIALDLKNALRHARGSDAEGALGRAVGETERVLAALHEMATRVRPSVLDDLGLADAIESYATELEQRTGLAVELDLRWPAAEPGGPLAENLYRIAQEALANAAAHAGADAVRVELVAGEREVTLRVEDRGRGFDPEQLKSTRRLGILGMRERVELLGGEFELDTAPGRGTRVEVRLPRGERIAPGASAAGGGAAPPGPGAE